MLLGLSNPDLELPLVQAGMFSRGEALSGNPNCHNKVTRPPRELSSAGVIDSRRPAAHRVIDKTPKERSSRTELRARVLATVLEINKHLLSALKQASSLPLYRGGKRRLAGSG